jgi:hypothetical protein
LPQDAADNPAALDRGFDVAMLICAGMFLLGGLVAWVGGPVGASRPLSSASAASRRWTRTVR